MWYILLAFFDVVVIAIQILVTFPIFAKFAEFFRAFVILVIITIFIRVVFFGVVAVKVLVTSCDF